MHDAYKPNRSPPLIAGPLVTFAYGVTSHSGPNASSQRLQPDQMSSLPSSIQHCLDHILPPDVFLPLSLLKNRPHKRPLGVLFIFLRFLAVFTTIPGVPPHIFHTFVVLPQEPIFGSCQPRTHLGISQFRRCAHISTLASCRHSLPSTGVTVPRPILTLVVLSEILCPGRVQAQPFSRSHCVFAAMPLTGIMPSV